MRKLARWLVTLGTLLVGAVATSWATAMPYKLERGVWRHEADGQWLTLSRLRARIETQSTDTKCPQDVS